MKKVLKSGKVSENESICKSKGSKGGWKYKADREEQHPLLGQCELFSDKRAASHCAGSEAHSFMHTAAHALMYRHQASSAMLICVKKLVSLRPYFSTTHLIQEA